MMHVFDKKRDLAKTDDTDTVLYYWQWFILSRSETDERSSWLIPYCTVNYYRISRTVSHLVSIERLHWISVAIGRFVDKMWLHLLIRNAAVLRKRKTAVYTEGGRNPLFECVSQQQK